MWYWGAFVLSSPKSACLKSAFPCRSRLWFPSALHRPAWPEPAVLLSSQGFSRNTHWLNSEQSVRSLNTYFNRVLMGESESNSHWYTTVSLLHPNSALLWFIRLKGTLINLYNINYSPNIDWTSGKAPLVLNTIKNMPLSFDYEKQTHELKGGGIG